MARTTDLASLEGRIEKAEAEVSRAKARYDKATAALKDLLDKRDALRREQLMKMFMESSRSFDEIAAFLTKKGDEESDDE